MEIRGGGNEREKGTKPSEDLLLIESIDVKGLDSVQHIKIGAYKC